jgi:hypothetical protein
MNMEIVFSEWGLCPQTPGIFRFPARIPGPQERDRLALAESRPLNRRSGSIPGEPCLPFRWLHSTRVIAHVCPDSILIPCCSQIC